MGSSPRTSIERTLVGAGERAMTHKLRTLGASCRAKVGACEIRFRGRRQWLVRPVMPVVVDGVELWPEALVQPHGGSGRVVAVTVRAGDGFGPTRIESRADLVDVSDSIAERTERAERADRASYGADDGFGLWEGDDGTGCEVLFDVDR